MSEHKPKSDADAVLASVRRIVTSGAQGDDADALVLMPSQRIDPAKAPAGEEAQRPAPRSRVQTRTLTAERMSLEQRIAELEAAVGDRGDWEPDGSEPGDLETPRRFALTPVREAGKAPVAPLQLQSAEFPAPDPVPRVEIRTAVAEPVVPADAPDPEPLVSLRRRTATESEPAANTAPDPDPVDDLTEESVIDEDILRDLVAEIVRSELQGELGERITRNVRKLVRREIHRALMTRDLG